MHWLWMLRLVLVRKREPGKLGRMATHVWDEKTTSGAFEFICFSVFVGRFLAKGFWLPKQLQHTLIYYMSAHQHVINIHMHMQMHLPHKTVKAFLYMNMNMFFTVYCVHISLSMVVTSCDVFCLQTKGPGAGFRSKDWLPPARLVLLKKFLTQRLRLSSSAERRKECERTS